MRKRELIKRYKSLMNIIIKVSHILPKRTYKILLKATRNWDSLFAIFLRYMCVKNLCSECGENIAIFSGVYVLNLEKLKIGSNVSIHPMCYIDAFGGIDIGNDVSIAHATTIMSTEHIYQDLKINIKDQESESRTTIIEDNVWIGSGCRILAGSVIGEGSIVAAGAVVKNEVQSMSIVGGIPAKLIKFRGKNDV